MSAWLEIRPSNRKDLCLDITGKTTEVILEVLDVAANAINRGVTWEYSRKLNAEELASIRRTIDFSSRKEDYRSISLSIDVTYKGSYYVLSLFEIKD